MKNTTPNEQQIIEKAKQGFGAALFVQDYGQIHLDDQHLTTLLQLCPLVKGKYYLDLGTGNGYIAFALAQQTPDIFIIGLDIVTKAIEANNQKAKAEQYHHLNFRAYQGIALPFADNEFFGVVSRYVFHHFPKPTMATQEIARIVEPTGFCLIADPIAHQQDSTDFINHFTGLKDDGHVRFYPQTEIETLFADAGFTVEEQCVSSLTFPRQMNRDYQHLIEQTPAQILEAYQLQLEADLVYVTVEVLNTRFRRR